MGYEVFAVAGEEVDDGHFNHGVAAGLLAHGGAGHADEYLTGEGGVVDAHIELEKLVLGGAAHALAGEVDAMSHVDDFVHRGDFDNVGFVVGKIGVRLDGCGDLGELMAGFYLDVDHAAVDACAGGDGHGEGSLDAGNGFDGNGVTHGHAGTEVGVGDALGGDGLQKGADNGVATRVPAGRDDADGTACLGFGVERAAELGNLGVDVEAVDGVDALGKYLLGVGFDAARGGAEDGDVDGAELVDVGNYGVVFQFGGARGVGVAAYDAGDFKVGRGLEGLEGVAADVAIAHYCCSDFFHNSVGDFVLGLRITKLGNFLGALYL